MDDRKSRIGRALQRGMTVGRRNAKPVLLWMLVVLLPAPFLVVGCERKPSEGDHGAGAQTEAWTESRDTLSRESINYEQPDIARSPQLDAIEDEPEWQQAPAGEEERPSERSQEQGASRPRRMRSVRRPARPAARRLGGLERLSQRRHRPRRPARAAPMNAPRRPPSQPDSDGFQSNPDLDPGFADIRVMERERPGGMTFRDWGVNPTVATRDQSVSTFGVDVDTASYNMARAHLNRGKLPDERAIRVEEMINAFDYAYQAPTDEAFLVQAEVFPSPNRRGYHVLHLGVKAREVSAAERKPANLVFVVDVSGSMRGAEKLGLVKRSLGLLVDQLDARDSVAIVVYGSGAHTVLSPTRTTAEGKDLVHSAIQSLRTEGSTNVQAGLSLGYEIAARRAGTGTVSRVVLCSDGVANVGATESSALLRNVSDRASRGVTISTVGFGMGNYNDTLMEQLADRGNGNYAYVDGIDVAQKIFVDRLAGTLEVVAKDLKVQMAFNPEAVGRYRLLGFENRMLKTQDFQNDRVDAGEIGAGHTVTAIYEIKLRDRNQRGALGTLRLRHKAPNGRRSRLTEREIPPSVIRSSYAQASAPTQLSMIAAGFGEKLRGSYWARNLSYADLLRWWDALPASLRDRAEVSELRSLIHTARNLDGRGDQFAEFVPIDEMDFDRVPVLR